MTGYTFTESGLKRAWWKYQDQAFEELGFDSSARAVDLAMNDGMSRDDLLRLAALGYLEAGMIPEPREPFAEQLTWALKPTGNLRLPRDPKRALADVQAVQRDMIERELQR